MILSTALGINLVTVVRVGPEDHIRQRADIWLVRDFCRLTGLQFGAHGSCEMSVFCRALKNVIERVVEIGKLKIESRLQQCGRQHPLSVQE